MVDQRFAGHRRHDRRRVRGVDPHNGHTVAGKREQMGGHRPQGVALDDREGERDRARSAGPGDFGARGHEAAHDEFGERRRHPLADGLRHAAGDEGAGKRVGGGDRQAAVVRSVEQTDDAHRERELRHQRAPLPGLLLGEVLARGVEHHAPTARPASIGRRLDAHPFLEPVDRAVLGHRAVLQPMVEPGVRLLVGVGDHVEVVGVQVVRPAVFVVPAVVTAEQFDDVRAHVGHRRLGGVVHLPRHETELGDERVVPLAHALVGALETADGEDDGRVGGEAEEVETPLDALGRADGGSAEHDGGEENHALAGPAPEDGDGEPHVGDAHDQPER